MVAMIRREDVVEELVLSFDEEDVGIIVWKIVQID